MKKILNKSIPCKTIEIIAIALLITFSSCAHMGGMENVADDFFGAVNKNDYYSAYDLTSDDFQLSISPDGLKKFLKSSHLIDAEKLQWTSSNVDNGVGFLSGKIISAGGKKIKIRMAFVEQNDNLRILSITRESSGNIATAGKLAMPGIDKIVELTRATFNDFAKAVNTADFNNFHSNISRDWRQQTTAPALQELFGEFIDKKIDLAVIEDAKLIFSENPNLSDDGILKLKGIFIAEPWDVHFTLDYVYEFPDWKLFSLSVELK